MTEQNASFGIPDAAPSDAESPEARITRLRAKAALQAAAEFDEDAVYAQLLADARADNLKKLVADKGVEFPLDTAGFVEDYDKINIYPSADPQSKGYVELGKNGFVIKVPRDTDVIIPHEFVVDVLDTTVETSVTQSKDGLILRNAKRFPYMFQGKATTAEYKAFQLAQKDKAQRQIAQAA